MIRSSFLARLSPEDAAAVARVIELLATSPALSEPEAIADRVAALAAEVLEIGRDLLGIGDERFEVGLLGEERELAEQAEEWGRALGQMAEAMRKRARDSRSRRSLAIVTYSVGNWRQSLNTRHQPPAGNMGRARASH